MLGILGPLRKIHLLASLGKFFVQYRRPLDDPSIDLPLKRLEIGKCKLDDVSHWDNLRYLGLKKQASVVECHLMEPTELATRFLFAA